MIRPQKVRQPGFAIIIPTAGRAAELGRCIESVNSAIEGEPCFEAIVIDNNQDMVSSRCVRTLVESCSLIRYARCIEPGLTSARHHALQETAAQVLCYIDDDVIITSEWIKSTINAFRDPEVALCGGPNIPLFSGHIPMWFWDFFSPTPYGGWCCPWLSLLDIGCDIDCIDPNWIWGLNFSIRRDALLATGGFHIDLVPNQYMRWQGDGETGLTMKLAERGYKAVYRQKSLLLHNCGIDRLNAEYFAKRAYYQGVCNSFTELRRKLRCGENIPTPPRPVTHIRRLLKMAIKRIKGHLRPAPTTPPPASPWAAAAYPVRSRCKEAEQAGYLFHQSEAANDQSLLEWISRDSYIGVDLRDLRVKSKNNHTTS